jgi:hypothetical protein
MTSGIVAALTLGCLLAQTPPVFATGAHLHNDDDVAHEVVLPDPLSTAICEVRTPSASIKRGLAGVTTRKPKGLTLRPGPKPLTAAAVITAKTRVLCVCVRRCTIEVSGLGAAVVSDGQTLVIRDGRLVVEPPPAG